jgi:hypothetical protein
VTVLLLERPCRTLLARIFAIGLMVSAVGPLAYAQNPTPDDAAASLLREAKNAAYYGGKVNQRSQQIRDLLFAAIGLIVVSALATNYLLFRRINGTGPDLIDRVAIRRIRARQASLAKAVVNLQAFAEQSLRTDEDLSALLSEMSVQIKQVEQEIGDLPGATP